MPTRKSGFKNMRASEKKCLRNARVVSNLKTIIKKYDALIAKGEKESAVKLYPRISSTLDKAAKRGIIHPNNASRKKSRLAAKIKG